MVMGYPEFSEDKPNQSEDIPDNHQDEIPEVKPTSIDSNLKRKEPVVNDIIAKIGVPYKSIIGFFTVFIGQLLARATVDDIPVLPETGSAWLSLIGGSFVAAAAIYFKANLYTSPQIEQKAIVSEKKHI